MELKYIAPNDICITLATQFHLPWTDLSAADIPIEIASALSGDIVRELKVIPVKRKDNTLIVASNEPQSPGLVGLISRHTRLKVELGWYTKAISNPLSVGSFRRKTDHP